MLFVLSQHRMAKLLFSNIFFDVTTCFNKNHSNISFNTSGKILLTMHINHSNVMFGCVPPIFDKKLQHCNSPDERGINASRSISGIPFIDFHATWIIRAHQSYQFAINFLMSTFLLFFPRLSFLLLYLVNGNNFLGRYDNICDQSNMLQEI